MGGLTGSPRIDDDKFGAVFPRLSDIAKCSRPGWRELNPNKNDAFSLWGDSIQAKVATDGVGNTLAWTAADHTLTEFIGASKEVKKSPAKFPMCPVSPGGRSQSLGTIS